MTATETALRNRTDSRMERYRRAEGALWDRYGLAPVERFVELDAPAIRLRVTEVGSGQPVLFVPGTGGTGPYWAPLVRELQDFRCLLLDRPGWGLSDPVDFSKREYGPLTADLLRGVLDALGVDRASVVASSVGNVWALRLAVGHPSRVERVALLSGGPLTPVIGPPAFVRLLRSPIGAVIVRLPEKPWVLRKQLRNMGHGTSLETGRILQEMLTWHMSFANDTHSLHNERDMIRAILGRQGWAPGVTFSEAELAHVEQPVLMVYGTADPVGSVDIWQRFVNQMPRAELEVVDGAGHVLWYDDPIRVGGRVRSFLVA